jgi:FixJ family two-component response regulator
MESRNRIEHGKAANLKKGVMISIVDDDASVREATKELVRSLGYSAAAFASAEDFLQSGQLGETACLISDVQMPGLSGIDLQRRLIADGHSLPIIFITAFPDERARTRALDGGAVGFLTKPYREESLIECLGQALKS